VTGVAKATRWPWIALVLAALWVVAIRVPLILNAADHLDSDLAVDGLTLREATQGHFRWHYPGTPFMGIGAVLLSLPQALIWGATPATLVSGGTIAYLGLLVATFRLSWRVGGPSVAGWSLVPLTFASTGMLWLSARITGGHLLAAAWHAGAFAMLAGVWIKGGKFRAFGLGFWCGFGLYLDSMLSVTILGLVLASISGWFFNGMRRTSIVAAVVFCAGFVGGVWPRPVGARLDPYDAYQDQFSITREPELLVSHGWMLAKECLPRLIAGHRLPGLESEPDPGSLSSQTLVRRREPFNALSAVVTGLALSLAVASALAILISTITGPIHGRIVCLGLFLSATATLAGFVANKNIYNSDNYRYLVGLLAPLSLGFGILADRVATSGSIGRHTVSSIVVLFAAMMTADTIGWYSRFGWVDGRGLPLTKAVDDPTLLWLRENPEVKWIEGGYWDVYRLAFLSEGNVRGAPFPVYPNRFPEWRKEGKPVILTRATSEGTYFHEQAIRDGYRVMKKARGMSILTK